MTSIEQIRALASHGQRLTSIVALLGRELTADELTEFRKARAVWELREVKRKAEKSASRLSDAGRKRAMRDREIDITSQLVAARDKIDWSRRKNAEESLEAWMTTYCMGTLINDPPPKPHGSKILREMEEARTAGRPYQILVGRGGGKTSYAEGDGCMCLATGRSKLLVISALNAGQAHQIKREMDAVFISEPFATDYPDIALPIILLDGHGRRSQRYCGRDTKVRITTDRTQLPTIVEKDGTASVASGACIVAKALKSVRGTKNGTQRPDKVILDDLQTREIARNEDRINEVVSLIRSDVMGLAGKKTLAITFTATTIERDDVTEVLAADPAWKTTRNPSVLAWPSEWAKPEHGLWGEYFRLFDDENIHDRPHDCDGGSIEFYRFHRVEMDAGADILNWGNFDADRGQISGLQRLMDEYHKMGHSSFMAEHQMEPLKQSFAFEISAALILKRIRVDVPALQIPGDSVIVVAATDINPSYGLTTAIVAFDINLTGLVVGYKVYATKIDGRLNDVAFNTKVNSALVDHAREIASLGLRIDKWGIDGGGRQFKVVTRFAPLARGQFGLDAIAMLGRAGQNWTPNVRSRIGNAINDTVYCRDPQGRRWLAFNADVHKERAQRAWGTEVGGDGGLSLYDGDANHTKFAIQVANEKLVEKKRIKNQSTDGEDKFAYVWKTKNPHDYGDCLAMCYALAASRNLTGDGAFQKSTKHHRRVYNG